MAHSRAAVASSSTGATDHAGTLSEARVVVVSTKACPYCKAAKEALTKAGIVHAVVDVSTDQELRTKVKDITGSRTVPQVFVDGKSIGGSDSLAAMLADGSFQKLLASSKGPALPASLLRQAEEAQAAEQKSREVDDAASQQLQQLQTLAAAMGDAKSGVPRTEVSVGGRPCRVFTGRQAVGWLMSQQQQQPGNRDQAVQEAQQLLQYNLMTLVWAGPGCPPQQPFMESTETRYMLVPEAPPVLPGQALNTHYWWYGPARSANQVSLELRQLILELYEAHLSADGRAVSYKKLGKDPLFKKYIDATAELQRVDISTLSTPELSALFINLYNALIVHALVAFGTEMNALQRAKFFANAKYNIGTHDYSADDMENGVLRGNRPAASNLWVLLGLPQFSGGQFPSKSDPRRNKVVSPVDPRIHFALVCGAKSCPPIKLYTPDNLDEGLTAAGEAFCASEVTVDRQRREVALSKIFKWYAVDFGANNVERLQWILPFLQGQAHADLEALLAGGGQDIKVKYKEYDWGLNTEEK